MKTKRKKAQETEIIVGLIFYLAHDVTVSPQSKLARMGQYQDSLWTVIAVSAESVSIVPLRTSSGKPRVANEKTLIKIDPKTISQYFAEKIFVEDLDQEASA